MIRAWLSRSARSSPWAASVVLMGAALLAGGSSCGGKAALPAMPSVPDPRLQTVLTSIAWQMERCAIPGGAIAIVQDGQVTEWTGFGVKDPGGAPVNASTLFQAGSLGKLAVGVAALRLVEEGALDPTQPMDRYAPIVLGQGFDPSTVPVAALFADAAGLPDVDTNHMSCGTGPGQLAAWFGSQPPPPLWFPPGTLWDFSQTNAIAAAWVIEGATSGSFEDAVASRVFGPANMATATYDPVIAAAGDFALGHAIDPAGRIAETFAPGQGDCEAFRASDGMYASVLDVAQLAASLSVGGGAVLSPSSMARLEAGQIADNLYPGEQYGYGMHLHEGYKGLSILRTSGAIHGFNSSVYVVPAQRFAAVVFFDADNSPDYCQAGQAAEEAVNVFLGLTDVPAPDWTTPPSTLEAYSGTYIDPYALGVIEVYVEYSKLEMVTSGGYTFLEQQSATAFTGDFGHGPETVTFAPGDDGQPEWLVMRRGVATRQSP
jgi:CubicO group peptidase (beta-lactamase class C family)